MTNALDHTLLLTCDEMNDLGMRVNKMLDQIENDLGPEAVWKLTGAYGGITIHLPTQDRLENSTVTARLGKPLAKWLFQYAGHGHLKVPMGPHARTARITSMCRASLGRGKSSAAIARELQCSIRTVERIEKRLRDAGFI